MEAVVKLKDIGNFKETELSFKSGCLNVLEMPNAAGKSIVLKSILAVHSFPLRSLLARELATRLGIWSSEPPQPLTRVGSDRGIIEITVDGEVRRCVVESSGDVEVNIDGDERLLFTSFVGYESELLRRISAGEEGLKWLLPMVSNVEDYERVSKIAYSIREDLSRVLELARGKQSRINSLRRELEELRSKLNSTDQRIAEVERELKGEKVDPEIKDRYDKVAAEVNSLRKRIEEEENELKEKKEELEKIAKELPKIEREIRRLEEEVNKIGEEEKKLGSEKNIKKELEEIESKLEELAPERRDAETLLNMSRSALNLKGKRCPLCGGRNIDPDYLRARIEEYEQKLREIDSKARSLVARKEKLNRNLIQLRELDKKLNEKLRELHIKQSEKDSLEKSMESIKPRITSLEYEISSLKQKLFEKEAEMNKLLSKIESPRAADLRRELLDLREERGRIFNKISSIEREIEESSAVRMLDSLMPIEEAISFCEKSIAILDTILEYTANRIDEQRRGFAKRFNDVVEKVIRDLGFEDLRMEIDPSELNVIVRRSGRYQPITSLSSSEKTAMATVLQIALMETFTPRVPFLLVDEVMESFDPERGRKIAEYLLQVARSRDIFVILARVGEKTAVKLISSVEGLETLFKKTAMNEKT